MQKCDFILLVANLKNCSTVEKMLFSSLDVKYSFLFEEDADAEDESEREVKNILSRCLSRSLARSTTKKYIQLSSFCTRILFTWLESVVSFFGTTGEDKKHRTVHRGVKT